jgi:hypothetical protein
MRKNTAKTTTFALLFRNADVAKLADALDLGSSAARHVGSTPSIRTTPFIRFIELTCFSNALSSYI